MWVKLDDKFPSHPKIVAAGPIAALIHVRAMCYAAANLTDGFIPFGAVPILVSGFEQVAIVVCGELTGVGRDVDDMDWPAILVEHGLWELRDDGYNIHDFLDYNPSKKDVLDYRKRAQISGRKGAKRRWSKEKRIVSNLLAFIGWP